MAALTADKRRQYQGTATEGHGPAAVDIFYVGALVSRNSSGYIVPASDTSGEEFMGVCVEYVDNSGGSAGDVNVKFAHNDIVERLAYSGSVTAAMLGEVVMVVDDQTVGLAADTTNDVEVGTIERHESGFVWVALRRGYSGANAA